MLGDGCEIPPPRLVCVHLLYTRYGLLRLHQRRRDARDPVNAIVGLDLEIVSRSESNGACILLEEVANRSAIINCGFSTLQNRAKVQVRPPITKTQSGVRPVTE